MNDVNGYKVLNERVEGIKEKYDELKAEMTEVWDSGIGPLRDAMEGKVGIKLFLTVLTIIILILGGIFTTQWTLFGKVSKVETSIAVMQRDVQHIQADIRRAIKNTSTISP